MAEERIIERDSKLMASMLLVLIMLKVQKRLRDDQIVVMRLPSSEVMESRSRKFREMFR
jgi:hypothetical protein